MIEKDIIIHFSEFETINDLDNESQVLMQEALTSCNKAYAPYSGFKVGAAVKCIDGSIITGNNQENAAYPSGLCAERVAIFSAMAQNPDSIIKQIAITVKTANGQSDMPVAPCGACRQVIAEYEHRQGSMIEILFSSETGKTIRVNSINSLLPFAFNSDYLH